MFGAAMAYKTIKSGKAKAVVFAENISPKTRKEVLFYSAKYGVKASEIKGVDILELSKAVGRKCGVVAVTDSNFSSSIISSLTSDV